MYAFTLEQRRISLYRLVFFHILIITASNYLVQFPFSIGNIHATWGALSFPFIFVATDLTVRIFGKGQARKIVFILCCLPCFCRMLYLCCFKTVAGRNYPI